MDLKEAYDSVKREVLYNIPTEFGIPMEPVRLVKMFLNETYRTVQVGKNLSDMFPIKKGFETRRCFIAIAFKLCFRVCHHEGSGKLGCPEKKWYTSASSSC
jgi:hypothetical protein